MQAEPQLTPAQRAQLASTIARLQQALDDFMQAAQATGYGDTVFWQLAAQASFTIHDMMTRYSAQEGTPDA